MAPAIVFVRAEFVRKNKQNARGGVIGAAKLKDAYNRGKKKPEYYLIFVVVARRRPEWRISVV